MNPKFIKGLLISLISVLLTAYSNQPIVWSLVIVSLIGTALIYTGKNAWFQSTSLAGNLNLKDALSVIILGLGNAIMSGISTLIIQGKIDWPAMLHLTIGVIVAYLGTTSLMDSKSCSDQHLITPKQ